MKKKNICGAQLKFTSVCKARKAFILPNGKPDWSCTVKPTIRYERITTCTSGHEECYGSDKPIKSFERFYNKGFCSRIILPIYKGSN